MRLAKYSLLAVVLLAVALPAVADTLVLNTTATLDDAWMWSGGGSSNNTGENSIQLRNNEGGLYLKHVYLGFDLSAIPAGQTITSAVYTAYTTGSGYTYDTAVIGAHYLTKPWVEGEISWSNYATDSAWDTAGGDYVSPPETTFTVPATAAYTAFTMDFTAFVQAWYAGTQTNNGLMLKFTADTPEQQLLWCGSEGHNEGSGYQHVSPYMTIGYTPEPATMTLLGLGGLGLLLRRKR